MSRHLLVALTGEKGSGKGVLARHLAAKHGYQIDSFAAPLKRMTTKLTGWTAEQLADPVFKETVDPRLGYSPRWFMQVLGTECVRDELGEDTWSRALVERINRKVSDQSSFHDKETSLRFVIDDLRFLNESHYLSNLVIERLVVRINRGGRPSTGDQHASEQEIYQIDADEELDVTWYPGEGGRAIGEADLIRDFEDVLKQWGFL